MLNPALRDGRMNQKYDLEVTDPLRRNQKRDFRTWLSRYVKSVT